MEKYGYVFAVPALLIMLIVSSVIDHDGEQREYKNYCSMVKLWDENRDRPPHDRPGWPPYKGRCHGYY